MAKLTDIQIRAWIKAGEHFDGRADGGGLYLCFPSSYMRPAQVMRHFQISESTLWNWVKNGKFPKPDRLSDGVTRFDVAELREWVKSRKTTSH